MPSPALWGRQEREGRYLCPQRIFWALRETRAAYGAESLPSQESKESGGRLVGADGKDCQNQEREN